MKVVEILEQIVSGNQEFVEQRKPEFFSSHSNQQKSFITLVS